MDSSALFHAAALATSAFKAVSNGASSPHHSGSAQDHEQTDMDLVGRRHSGGSMSTLEPSDWRSSGEQLLGANSLSMSPNGQHALSMLGEASLQHQRDQRSRRNPRQQEQNKQAQQRYRAKRKAQFEELQRKVTVLSDDAMEAQRQQQENEMLRSEIARLKSQLQAAAAKPAVAAIAAQPPVTIPTNPQQNGTSPPQHCQPQQPQQQQNGSLDAQQGNGVANGTANGVAWRHPSSPAHLTAKQVHAALGLFYDDLQAYAASVQLEAMPTDGMGLAADAAEKLNQLVHAGLELVKMVLQASGPDAAALLTANMAPACHDGTSPADSLGQWTVVALRVGLTPDQRTLLASWRLRFLKKIDDCYGRRLLHKAQLTQLPGNSLDSQQQPWVEALLLQAAESVGFSACALSCAQLDGVVAALAENLCEERATACAMMGELLEVILTKVQAAKFLLAGHPFCWNGLSFAHAVAAMQHQGAATGAAVPPAQLDPLAQLLAHV